MAQKRSNFSSIYSNQRFFGFNFTRWLWWWWWIPKVFSTMIGTFFIFWLGKKWEKKIWNQSIMLLFKAKKKLANFQNRSQKYLKKKFSFKNSKIIFLVTRRMRKSSEWFKAVFINKLYFSHNYLKGKTMMMMMINLINYILYCTIATEPQWKKISKYFSSCAMMLWRTMTGMMTIIIIILFLLACGPDKLK